MFKGDYKISIRREVFASSDKKPGSTRPLLGVIQVPSDASFACLKCSSQGTVIDIACKFLDPFCICHADATSLVP